MIAESSVKTSVNQREDRKAGSVKARVKFSTPTKEVVACPVRAMSVKAAYTQ